MFIVQVLHSLLFAGLEIEQGWRRSLIWENSKPPEVSLPQVDWPLFCQVSGTASVHIGVKEQDLPAWGGKT